VNERIHFINHQKKQILLVDFSNCQSAEVEKIARAVPDYVSNQPRSSVLVLSDFTGASLDQDAIRAMKETAVFDKPYIRKSALVGGANLPQALGESLRDFSRREFPTFKTRQEALSWLVGND
jgi:mannose/fructose-specific phosphotransferase system component IIA